MNFTDVMKKFAGKWEDGRALITDQGGYIWAIATGTPENFTLTHDGRRYVTASAEPAGADNLAARRGRKPASVVESVNT